jgi:hypothetical protein
VYGVVSSPDQIPSEEDVEQVKKVIHGLIAELHMQETLRKEVLAMARERTTHHIIEEMEFGPTHKEEELSYGHLQERGIDTVLELSVLSIGMQGETGIDPELTLSVTVGGRLIRVVDGSWIKKRTFTHKSDSHVFPLWGANGAEVFRKELETAYQELGSKITTNFLQMAIR